MKSLKSLFGIAAGSVALLHSAFAQNSEKPNIIIIYADDLGYDDVSSYSAKRVSTPNIDRPAGKFKN